MLPIQEERLAATSMLHLACATQKHRAYSHKAAISSSGESLPVQGSGCLPTFNQYARRNPKCKESSFASC